MITSDDKDRVVGEFTYKPSVWDKDGRGVSIYVNGVDGIYVGTTPTGRDWYAYEPEMFFATCEEFDLQFPRVNNEHTK